MITFLLPGFSSKNKEWVDELEENIPNSKAIHWPHWENGETKDGWNNEEARKIINMANGKKFNILAKSVGTIVAMHILKDNCKLVNKIILCGIPVSLFLKNDEELFKYLSCLDEKNILCIQNDLDPSSDINAVRSMLEKINKNIKIVIKPLDLHHYPYTKDFISFFEGNI